MHLYQQKILSLPISKNIFLLIYHFDSIILDYNKLPANAVEFVNTLKDTGRAVVQLLEAIEKLSTNGKESSTMMSLGAAVGSIIIGSHLLMEMSMNMVPKTYQALEYIKKVCILLFLQVPEIMLPNRLIRNLRKEKKFNTRVWRLQYYEHKYVFNSLYHLINITSHEDYYNLRIIGDILFCFV